MLNKIFFIFIAIIAVAVGLGLSLGKAQDLNGIFSGSLTVGSDSPHDFGGFEGYGWFSRGITLGRHLESSDKAYGLLLNHFHNTPVYIGNLFNNGGKLRVAGSVAVYDGNDANFPDPDFGSIQASRNIIAGGDIIAENNSWGDHDPVAKQSDGNSWGMGAEAEVSCDPGYFMVGVRVKTGLNEQIDEKEQTGTESPYQHTHSYKIKSYTQGDLTIEIKCSRI